MVARVRGRCWGAPSPGPLAALAVRPLPGGERWGPGAALERHGTAGRTPLPAGERSPDEVRRVRGLPDTRGNARKPRAGRVPMRLLSVVVPVKDERENVRPLVARVR